MKITVDFTRAKNMKEGITMVAYNLLSRLSVKDEILGCAFVTLREKKAFFREYYVKNFPFVKMKIKKSFLPNRMFYHNNFQFLVPYQVFFKPSDLYIFFYNLIPFGFKKQNTVVFIHDLSELKNEKNIKKYQQMLKSFKHTVTISKLIITDSEFSRREIEDSFPLAKDKIKVLYCGVDSKKFTKIINPDQIKLIKAKYHLPDQYILFIGQPRINKNLPRLLRAYACLPETLKKQYGLVIANSNEQLKNLVEELNLSNNVALLHGIAEEDVMAIYHGARALSLISTNEGFGLPMVEAMASGIPVICSNVSCLPEIAGDAALMVDPYNEDEITQGLIKILTDDVLRHKLQLAGQKRANCFTWENATQKFREYLGEIIK